MPDQTTQRSPKGSAKAGMTPVRPGAVASDPPTRRKGCCAGFRHVSPSLWFVAVRDGCIAARGSACKADSFVGSRHVTPLWGHSYQRVNVHRQPLEIMCPTQAVLRGHPPLHPASRPPILALSGATPTMAINAPVIIGSDPGAVPGGSTNTPFVAGGGGRNRIDERPKRPAFAR